MSRRKAAGFVPCVVRQCGRGRESVPDCLTERGAVRAQSPEADELPPPLPPGVPADALQKFGPAPPPVPRVSEPSQPDDGVDLPGEDELRTDSELARTALAAAVLGPFACGLFTIYSLYLIIKLSKMPGQMTPRASRQVLFALVIDLVWFVSLPQSCIS